MQHSAASEQIYLFASIHIFKIEHLQTAECEQQAALHLGEVKGRLPPILLTVHYFTQQFNQTAKFQFFKFPCGSLMTQIP